ncbi:MAG TPA: hypothetical protein VIP77_15270 [Jiangellaceae bacterium]
MAASSDFDGTPIGMLSAAVTTYWQRLMSLHARLDRMITQAGRDILALPAYTPGAEFSDRAGPADLPGYDDLFEADGRSARHVADHAGPTGELIGLRRQVEEGVGIMGALRTNVDALRSAGDHATARGHIDLVTTQLTEMRELQGEGIVVVVDVFSGTGERPESWWRDLEELQHDILQADTHRADALATALEVQAAIEGE